MAVVSVSMPDELLERLDQFAEEHGYTGRSEVVRRPRETCWASSRTPGWKSGT